MSLSSIFRKKQSSFFSKPEEEQMVNAIQLAEKDTSGEVRLYIESHCRFVDPLDRAAEIFYDLKMNATSQHNGVLVYIAMKDHQLAVFADDGIFKAAGKDFWNNAVREMIAGFQSNHYADAICGIIEKIGKTLTAFFPYDAATDKNELPDDIVFGK